MDQTVSGLVVASEGSTLALTFDAPLSEADATAAAQDLSEPGDVVVLVPAAEPEAGAATRARVQAVARRAAHPAVVNRAPAAAAAAAGGRLSCGNQLVDGDNNGTFKLDFRCDLSPKRLTWGWKMHPVLASFVVGTMKEDGLRWFKDGASMPKNAPHTVSPLYNLHGTMNPTPVNSYVQYQDFVTFRHSIGSGGTGQVSFGGAVTLKKTEESD